MLERDPRINEKIPAAELRVIDENQNNLGLLKKEEAIRIAKEKGLDLIEISSNTNPPVAKIMSFDKYRYEKKKKEKKQNAGQKGKEAKQIQITVRSAKNDLEIKVKQLEKFLGEGHPISIVLVLKGREKANKDWAHMKLAEFMKMITMEYSVLSSPKFSGRGINAFITKK